MNQSSTNEPFLTTGDMADHITEARQRARRLLDAETHLGGIDETQAAVARARDAILLVWLIWLVLEGFSVHGSVGMMLMAAGAGAAVLRGLQAAVSIRNQVQYYESELHRERREIRDEPEHEREEVRSLYAAKGFTPPLLDQIVETICADDDRLLKVMMEEELGLFLHRFSHPVQVGLWSCGGALAGAMALAVPVCFLGQTAARIWMPVGGASLLVVLAVVAGRRGGRTVPRAAAWLLLGGVSGGVVHFLSQLLAAV